METHWGIISVKKADFLFVSFLCSLHFVDLIQDFRNSSVGNFLAPSGHLLSLGTLSYTVAFINFKLSHDCPPVVMTSLPYPVAYPFLRDNRQCYLVSILFLEGSCLLHSIDCCSTQCTDTSVSLTRNFPVSLCSLRSLLSASQCCACLSSPEEDHKLH